ncbi:MAG: hypothetical protein DDT19_02217 [Syntrophomonadaceae bacterium]|nr:hypothetical protein [Bacillota bacterium]
MTFALAASIFSLNNKFITVEDVGVADVSCGGVDSVHAPVKFATFVVPLSAIALLLRSFTFLTRT